jgi:hypothetical protein
MLSAADSLSKSEEGMPLREEHETDTRTLTRTEYGRRDGKSSLKKKKARFDDDKDDEKEHKRALLIEMRDRMETIGRQGDTTHQAVLHQQAVMDQQAVRQASQATQRASHEATQQAVQNALQQISRHQQPLLKHPPEPRNNVRKQQVQGESENAHCKHRKHWHLRAASENAQRVKHGNVASRTTEKRPPHRHTRSSHRHISKKVLPQVPIKTAQIS